MRRGKREPGLLRRLVDIYWEQAARRRALREMARVSWSVDFLSLVLARASRNSGEAMSLVIERKDGSRITLTSDAAARSGAEERIGDSVFDRLDDEAAVEKFIADHSRRA